MSILNDDIGDLVADPRGRPRKEEIRRARDLVEGVFSRTPADTMTRCFVTIESFDGGRREFGPCPWSAKILDTDEYGTPEEGDLALVGFNEEDEPWIVEWWPANG